MTLQEHLQIFPFIAITRGLSAEKAIPCTSVLADRGFRIIETPLNAPDALNTIEQMAGHFLDLLIGAGTVITVEQVRQVKAAGGRIIVSPNCNLTVIEETKAQGLISIPGVGTATEAFQALAAGADGLKLFPAEMIPPAAVKALLAVLPKYTPLIPVGGIAADNWQSYRTAGAMGFGLGSSLYSPRMSIREIEKNALEIKTSWENSR